MSESSEKFVYTKISNVFLTTFATNVFPKYTLDYYLVTLK